MTPSNPQIQKSLHYSIIDGVFFTIMLGSGERFFVPFALMLGAGYFEVGLVVALPLLFGSLSQLFSTHLIEKINSRKKVVMGGVFLQALMFAPMILLYFSPLHPVYLFIGLTIGYWICGHIVAPAWNSWMGDLVELQSRGSYFGKRSRIMEFSTLITFMIAGWYMHIMKEGHQEYIGFLTLFAVALVARLMSFHFLNKKYEPYFETKNESKFTFLQFVKKMKTTNFGHFVFFAILMNFSFYVSAPYFTPYMLKELHFSYFQYMVIVAASMTSRIVFMSAWGKFIDQYGTRKILALSASFLPITVLFWLFSANFYWIVAIHIMAGFVWSGFELSSFNFILDSTSSEKRARCVAYYNVLNGVFILLGSLLGSALVKMNLFSATPVYTAFLGSFVLRILFTSVFLPQLKEVRTVETITYRKLFLQTLLQPVYILKRK